MRLMNKAALAAAGLAVALTGCGSSPQTVRGSVEDCTTALNPGDQITVTDPSGSVIGTGTLDAGVSTPLPAALLPWAAGTGYAGDVTYKFRVTVPGETRYGVTVGTHGTIWFTPREMTAGPALALGC
jgi:hypothetical protein